MDPLEPTYDYLSASTSTKDIESMCKSNLVNELVKHQIPCDDIITVPMAQNYSMSDLVTQVRALRDALRKKSKPVKKKIKALIIKADTDDSVVTSMSQDVAHATYMSCMRKLKQKVDKNDLNLLTFNDLVDGIFKYRKHLITQKAAAPKPPTSGAQNASPMKSIESTGDAPGNTPSSDKPNLTSTTSPTSATSPTNVRVQLQEKPIPVTQEPDISREDTHGFPLNQMMHQFLT